MKNNIFSLSIFAIFAMALSSCGPKETTGVVVNTNDKEIVKVQKLEKINVARELDVTTTLEGYETMNVSPSLTGLIEHIYVEVGDKVKTNDDLVRMDQNQYNTSMLTYNNLKVELSRVEALRESGSIAEQVYDQTKLQFDQIEESLSFIKENTFVKAPFSGVISAKNYEDGELYAGQAILVLTQIDKLKAYINVPETYFPMVKSGMKAKITSPIYPDEVFDATIEVVYPTIDPASHTFTVKLIIPNEGEKLRPGMYANTYLQLGEESAMVVPYQSVLKLQGSNIRYVFINDNGVAKYVEVQLGKRFDDMIEIISDEISENDELVVVGQSKLVNGSKLEIQR